MLTHQKKFQFCQVWIPFTDKYDARSGYHLLTEMMPVWIPFTDGDDARSGYHLLTEMMPGVDTIY